MATKKKGSAGLTADEKQAQAEIKLSRWLDVVDQSEQLSIGTFYNMPPEYTNGWMFMRCGLKNQPRTEALAATMREMGYQDAPFGVRMRGFETDGENAVYLCIPEKFYRRIQARKVQARKRQAQRIDSMVRGHAAQIRGMLGSDSQVTVTGSTEIK